MSHARKQRLFYKKMIQNFDYHGKYGKRNWVSASLSSKMHYMTRVNNITYGKLSGVPLNILSSVFPSKDVVQSFFWQVVQTLIKCFILLISFGSTRYWVSSLQNGYT